MLLLQHVDRSPSPRHSGLLSLPACILTQIALHGFCRENKILAGTNKGNHSIILPLMRKRAQATAPVIQRFWRARCKLFSTKALIQKFLRVTRLSQEMVQTMR